MENFLKLKNGCHPEQGLQIRILDRCFILFRSCSNWNGFYRQKGDRKRMDLLFAGKMSSKHLNLTPTEMQVADFVRNGFTNKEISSQLNVSVEAINFHRRNIRKKLGLTNRKTNLQSYLQRLSD